MPKPQEEPNTLRLIVVFLRFYARMTQAELGRAAGVDQALISRYESGQQAPPEEAVKRMAAAVGVAWPLVMNLRRVYSSVLRLSRQAEEADGFGVESLEPLLDRTLTVLGDAADPTVTKLLYLLDPDGTRIEVMENVPDLSQIDTDALAARFE